VTPTIAWHACAPFQCGTLSVPLDYNHPSGQSISIALIRLPAADPSTRIGSLLVNPGGPGASGVQFLRDAFSLFNGPHARFDLVSFDPRGIGASTSVHCLSAATLDAINALDPILDDPQEKQATIDADKTFAAGCQARSAALLPYLSTDSTARDLDLIRIALGDQQLTYLGFSYGTFLGLTYARLFPTHIRALVLDGVFDPALDANTLLKDQLTGFEDNLQGFFTNCRAHAHVQPLCANAQSGDPQTKLNALMTQLDTAPLVVGSRSLTRGLAVIGVLTPLYSPNEWSLLDNALSAAEAGDGAPLLSLSDLYLDRRANGTYSNEEESGLAINCLDRPVPPDIASYDALTASFALASPFFGAAFQYSNLTCAYWPAPPVMTPAIASAPGAPPFLLVSATHDPATPDKWAQDVHSQLPSSVLLTRDGYGHTSYGFEGSAGVCINQVVNAYLISLTLPAAGLHCA
jgi:pimeloyl-ACP methyl ester carboxylesterase